MAYEIGSESPLPCDSHYTDFGARTLRSGEPNRKARQRPHCVGCGAFAGRYMRRVGTDAVGIRWVCRGCDEE
jgi:hypothetical protein